MSGHDGKVMGAENGHSNCRNMSVKFDWIHGRLPRLREGGALYRPPRSLGSLVAGFKSSTTRRINILRGSPGKTVWQKNYHEHVIRNDMELAAIGDYIQRTPVAGRTPCAPRFGKDGSSWPARRAGPQVYGAG
jgi:hypothetical protein